MELLCAFSYAVTLISSNATLLATNVLYVCGDMLVINQAIHPTTSSIRLRSPH